MFICAMSAGGARSASLVSLGKADGGGRKEREGNGDRSALGCGGSAHAAEEQGCSDACAVNHRFHDRSLSRLRA